MDTAADFPQLLAGLRAGDRAAADRLCREFEPFLRLAVRRQLHPGLRTRFDSIDFIQDVWAAFLAMPADAHTFATPQDLLTFLSRVAQNKVVQVVRQRFKTEKCNITREQPVETDEEGREQLPSGTPTPSQHAMAGEAWEQLLSQFPPGQRAVLDRLREGHSYEDIARSANVSLSTVNRVVRRLKEITGL